MLKQLLGGLAALLFFLPAIAFAQAGPGMTVVAGSSCPSTTVVNVGNNRPLIGLTTGALCTAAGSTPGGSAVNIQTAGSAGNAAVKGCDLHTTYDASDTGSKTLVAGVASKKIYICGYILATGGTAASLSLSSGTGGDCVTTSVNITPAYQLVANDRTGANSPFWNGLNTLTAADNLCVKASAAVAHQVEVWYTIQ
jgi:hypothetical protein